ncbi:MAG TPA: MFS transporter, partial [Vicinamibacterales bacterium]
FILGPALGGIFGLISYTAPIWVAAALTLVATVIAWLWLPETVHRGQAAGRSALRVLPELLMRPGLRVLLGANLLYWTAFAIYQTTFALFGEMRFHFDLTETGYFLAGFGLIGVIVQVTMIGPIVKRFSERWVLIIGLFCGALGMAAATWTYSVWWFAVTLIPAALGVGLCNPALLSMLSRAASADEQGRVQGASSALSSLGRTIGPVWGNGALERFSEATAYESAALILVLAAVFAYIYRPFSEPSRDVATPVGR